MRTHAPSWRTVAFPVAFAITCVVLTVVMVRVLGGTVPFAAQGYRFSFRLPDATGLVVGSDVDTSGVKIGRVVEVRRQGNAAVLTVELGGQYVPLHDRATVTTRLKSALGEGYVDVALGPASAPALPDGAMLPDSQVDPSVTLSQFLGTFDPATRAHFRTLFDGMARAFGGREQQLSDDTANTANVFEDLQGIFGKLDAERPQLAQMFASTGSVLDALGTREGIVQSTIENGDRLLAETANSNRALAATVHALPAFLGQVRSTAGELTAISPYLNSAVTSLVPAAPLFKPTLQASLKALPTVQRLFAELPPAMRAGDRALPTVPGTVAAARAGFKEFYPAARNLIPLLQLLAEERNALITLAPAANSVSGASVAPNGDVVANAQAASILSNEIIAGWAKKLPSNRPNPYVNAASLTDVERFGYPRSYDCRQTHNPEYLPPIFGAPPCTLQGPIDFNGKVSDFPHLTMAPP